MDRILLVVDDDAKTIELGEQAGELAAGINAELHVVQFIDISEYQDRLQQAATGSRKIESIDEASTHARELAQEFADKVLEGLDVDLITEGVVEDMPEAVVDYATEHDCDQIFITGQKRSPTGKAIFGDIAQSVILDFDGPVTVRVT